MDTTVEPDISPQKPCPHQRIEGFGNYNFAYLNSSSDICRLCCLYRDIALSCIRGELPGLSGPLYKNKDDERSALEETVISYNHRQVTIHVSEKEYPVTIFRDRETEEDNDFTVEGQRFSKGYRLGRYTNSKENIERAQKWLSECLASHTCPKPSTSGVPLPKRLLLVDGSSTDPIRLTETKGNEHPYVCLSHRWGDPKHKQLKTTTRTIQGHMDEIKWHDLPATFQDAVTVCRSMDVKYLWIDSLCILQSFPGITPDELETTGQDFAQENSTMARTYQNSHFTISADLSTHMDSGMFSKYRVDEHKMEVTTDDGHRAFLYIRQGNINHYERDIPDLETRGWTLQEFLLPPRVLHFGVFDLEWRCKTRITCGCGQLDLNETRQASWHRHHFIEESTKPPPDDAEGALTWWEQVVNNYTGRQLTNAADKLPALSGLAQQRKQVRGGVYLAGLWQDSLLHDLCWHHAVVNSVPEEGGMGRRPVHYRAPSWSWASLDTDSGCCWWWVGVHGRHPISPGREPEPACVILDAVCEPATTDPTGAVNSGYLDLEAALISAEICKDPEDTAAWTMHRLETPLTLRFFKPDCELEYEDLAFGDLVYCAPIAQVITPTGLQYGCLVLKQLDPDTYQRVGFCILGIGHLRPTRGLWYGSSREQKQSPDFNAEDYVLPDSDRVRIRVI